MKKWGKQVFLNEPGSGDSGAITCYVQVEKGYRGWSLNSEFKVWDCDRKVHLNFCASGDELSEKRKKLDRFEQVTQMFVKKYREALDQAEKQNADE